MVNGTPTNYFKGFRGLRHGCPLSPLLFLLVIEGLSKLIDDARKGNKIKSIKISHHLCITHLLSIDDV